MTMTAQNVAVGDVVTHSALPFISEQWSKLPEFVVEDVSGLRPRCEADDGRTGIVTSVLDRVMDARFRPRDLLREMEHQGLSKEYFDVVKRVLFTKYSEQELDTRFITSGGLLQLNYSETMPLFVDTLVAIDDPLRISIGADGDISSYGMYETLRGWRDHKPVTLVEVAFIYHTVSTRSDVWFGAENIAYLLSQGVLHQAVDGTKGSSVKGRNRGSFVQSFYDAGVSDRIETFAWSCLATSLGERYEDRLAELAKILSFTEIAPLWHNGYLAQWLRFGLAPEQIAGRLHSGVDLSFFDAIDD